MPRNPTSTNTPAQSRPDYAPEHKVTEPELDAAVEDSFPASDPPAHSVVRPQESPASSCPCHTKNKPPASRQEHRP